MSMPTRFERQVDRSGNSPKTANSRDSHLKWIIRGNLVHWPRVECRVPRVQDGAQQSGRRKGAPALTILRQAPLSTKGATMERKKASDFPPEVLKLFDGYVHGLISRRDFLDHAAKFAVGGFTAAAMLEYLRPNYAFAQQVAKDDARIKTEYLTYPSPQGSGTISRHFARQ